MKLNKVLTVSASVLAVAALTATQAKAAGTNNTASGNHVEAIAAAPNVSSVTIKAQSGDAARLYIVPDEQYPSTLYVGNGSTHAVLSTQVKGSQIWFEIGENMWVKATDTTYVSAGNKSGSNSSSSSNSNAGTKTNTNTGSNTSKTSSNDNEHLNWSTVNASGTVTIKNPKGAILYSDPDKETKTGRVLPNKSSWKVFAIRHNGELWFNLGGKQWVSGLDIDESTSTAKPIVIPNTPAKPSNNNSGSTSTSSVKMTPERGVARVTYRTPIVVWGQPGAKPLGKYLKPGTSWKYFGKTTVNGETWYNLGGNQWLPLRYLYVSGAQPTQSQIDKELAQRTSGTVVVAYATPIVVWGQPGAKPTKKYLRNKTAWHFFKKTEVNGTTWYNLGGNQWVPSTYVYVRFRN